MKGNEAFTEDPIEVAWRSPSNIALIKYWGKHNGQLPINPSLSMTLSNSFSETSIKYRPGRYFGGDFHLVFLFEGEPNIAFEARIKKYLHSLLEELAFLKDSEIIIESQNSFPHSAGIASSASFFSSLALSLATLEGMFSGKGRATKILLPRASHLARLGSGSACRSVYGGFVSWGKLLSIKRSNDYTAMPLSLKHHPLFSGLRDTILIIDEKHKSVSSSAGHETMQNHPFRFARIQQAKNNMNRMLLALETGDWKLFSSVAENEALTLHALMMSSEKGFSLLHQNTLLAIEKIHKFRQETGARICFTIDAGPNVHLLYPAEDENIMQNFISEELVQLTCRDYKIDDMMGQGPIQIFN